MKHSKAAEELGHMPDADTLELNQSVPQTQRFLSAGLVILQ